MTGAARDNCVYFIEVTLGARWLTTTAGGRVAIEREKRSRTEAGREDFCGARGPLCPQYLSVLETGGRAGRILAVKGAEKKRDKI